MKVIDGGMRSPSLMITCLPRQIVLRKGEIWHKDWTQATVCMPSGATNRMASRNVPSTVGCGGVLGQGMVDHILHSQSRHLLGQVSHRLAHTPSIPRLCSPAQRTAQLQLKKKKKDNRQTACSSVLLSFTNLDRGPLLCLSMRCCSSNCFCLVFSAMASTQLIILWDHGYAH